jgi:ABC-type siderophore export system fused ATPase/permease subunit
VVCYLLHICKGGGECEETTRITSSQNLEELQAKIDIMTDNMIIFSKIEKQEDIDIKQQFLEIIVGAKRLKIDKSELQRMFNERLQGRGRQAARVESHVKRVLSSNWNRVFSSN